MDSAPITPYVTVISTHRAYANRMETSRTLEDLRAEARRNMETANQRRRLLASFRRLDAELLRWRRWDVDQCLPAEQQQGLRAPNVDRETVTELRAAVLRQLRAFTAAGW